MRPSRFFVASVSLVALLGAGCGVFPGNPWKVSPAQPAARMAFGKIGGLGKAAMQGSAGTSDALYVAGAVPPNAGGGNAMFATRVSAPTAVGQALPALGMPETMSWAPAMPVPPDMATRPYPYPSPKLATVEYVVPDVLPSWGGEGDVIKLTGRLPDTGAARTLAERSGLPGELLKGVEDITGLNVQWHDGDDLSWNYDAASRSLSVWRDQPMTDPGSPLKMPPERITALPIADAFLVSHGFGDIKARGGSVDPLPWEVMPMAGGTGVSYPCMMERAVDGSVPPAMPVSPPGASEPAVMMLQAEPSGTPTDVLMVQGEPADTPVTDVKEVSPTIWPGPCGWDGYFVTVSYPERRSGQSIVHLGGWPISSASVVVDLRSQRVSSANLLLPRSEERSSYPLIDAATALRRLQAGGLNPVWPYAENGSIRVVVEKVELVWLRHETWSDGRQQTYDLPALLASGKVYRGDSKTSEEYRTLVPLLTDEALDESIDWSGGGGGVPVPVPMMMESGGSSR